MSVLFTAISEDNPVRDGDVQSLLAQVNIEARPEDLPDLHLLLAAVHDCAQIVDSLDDYLPTASTEKYPREAARRPAAHEQVLGHAWAHRCFIRGADEGLLARRTVSVKDNIAIAGVPQMYGTDAWEPWVPRFDATVVSRVLDAGADILGTSTCENLCHSTSSFTSAQGVVDNPYHAGYSAGGSTSGGCALVGAGLVDLTLGADQGGSIRVPAALCGCVGLKPTFGLVPYTGISSGDALNDHAGPIARNVLDVARLLDAIAGHDGLDDRSEGAPAPGTTRFTDGLLNISPSTTPLAGFRIGLVTEGFEHPIVDVSVREMVRAAARRYTSLGAHVEEVSVPDHLLGPHVWTIQQRFAGSQNLLGNAHGRQGLQLTALEQGRLPWTSESFQRSFPSTQNVIINGLYLTRNFPGLYNKTINLARRLRDSYNNVLESFDVLIMPTTPFVAPPHGCRGTPMQSLNPSMGLIINTAIFNITGLPGLTLPVGFSPSKHDPTVRLPVGMQIVSGLHSDDKILRAAYAWETAFDWRQEMKPKASTATTALSGPKI